MDHALDGFEEIGEVRIARFGPFVESRGDRLGLFKAAAIAAADAANAVKWGTKLVDGATAVVTGR